MLPGFRTHEAQVLDVSLQKNWVRDTVIGKRKICLDSGRSPLQEYGPSQRASAMAMECGVVGFL